MEIETYDITGRVIETQTRNGISNLRVEAWDKDIKYNDLLGNAITNEDGGFSISFDSTYFRENTTDSDLDLFFKVYRGKTLLKSTEDNVLNNADIQKVVTITIDLPGVRPEGKDRITSTQVLKAADFFKESDFKGVYDQFRSKAGTSLGFVTDMIANTIGKLDLEPVKVSSRKNEDIVGQDVDTAKRNLAAENIEVTEVRKYNPKLNAASLNDFAAFPIRLKQGQKVNLYEENGKIRYYSIAKEKTASSKQITGTVDVQNDKLQRLEEELTTTRQNAVEKDEQISKLKQEMDDLRREHDEIKSLLNSENVKHLLQNLQKMEQTKGSEKDTGEKSGGEVAK